MPRKVALFTGHRAEEGHINAIASGIHKDPRLAWFLIDGPLGEHPNTLSGTAKAIGASVIETSKALDVTRPDVLIAYGDRPETFAAVIAASQMCIPVAHVEGGDWTEGGCTDDNVRHAVTKLAHLHFATHLQAANRLTAMGESPDRIWVVGLPILDEPRCTAPGELSRRYGLDLDRPVLVFCQHPTPTENDASAALDALTMANHWLAAQVICLAPNGDPGSDEISRAVHRSMFFVYENLPRDDYHGLLAIASAVVGNSSAGLKEAPAFSCPCVNVGKRQRGRERGDNVIDVDHNAGAIYRAITRAIAWRQEGVQFTSPYSSRNAGKLIADVLATVDLENLLIKRIAA